MICGGMTTDDFGIGGGWITTDDGGIVVGMGSFPQYLKQLGIQRSLKATLRHRRLFTEPIRLLHLVANSLTSFF